MNLNNIDVHDVEQIADKFTKLLVNKLREFLEPLFKSVRELVGKLLVVSTRQRRCSGVQLTLYFVTECDTTSGDEIGSENGWGRWV